MPNTLNGRFAINHTVAPKLDVATFFAIARDLGVKQVEIRNDLAGVEILAGRPPSEIGKLARDAGLTILTINALQRFNDWSAARAREAVELAKACKDSGAQALILVPVNDTAYTPTETEKAKNLRAALKALQPILADQGVTGLVEPLGFVECSLRNKADAVAAIDDTGTAATFKLTHDTFHHHVAGETALFPDRTGLVHISGVTDPAVGVATMRDQHRVLVSAVDQVGNLAQIAALTRGGYSGPLSFEPFAPIGAGQAAITAALRGSIELMLAA